MVSNSSRSGPPQPLLSDRESFLFAAFVWARFDTFKLAQEQSLSPQELLAFIQSAAVRAQLRDYRAFAEEAFLARAVDLRAGTLDILHQVAATTPNLVEKRRAATSLTRGLQLPRQRQSPPDLDRDPPVYYASGRLSKPSPDDDAPDDAASDESLFQSETPALLPSPEVHPLRVAQIITDCLANPVNNRLVSNAYPFLAPKACLGNLTAPTIVDFANIVTNPLAPRGLSTAKKTTQISDSPTRTTFSIHLTNSHGYHNRYTLHLARDQPTSPWLVTHLNRQDSS